MKVPDGIEPAVGYRVWEVRNDRLYSLRHHEVWVPFEEFHAKCQKDATHKPPVESCTCGLYAAATFNRLFDMGYTKQGGLFSGQPDDIVIAGSVNIWGDIIPGHLGWRSSIAYPKKFLIPYSNWKVAKSISEAYGVPYKLFNLTRTH